MAAPTVLPVPRFDGQRVLVVGDVMVDRYWYGDAQRISPEAPVPVVGVDDEEERPGGAANVALNVAALGAACTLVGVVGDDDAGRRLRERLEAAGVDCAFVVVPGARTTVKLRVVSRHQQLLRLDFEQAWPADVAAAVVDRVRAHAPGAAIAVVEDYDKGAVDAPEAVLAALAAAAVPALVDPKHKPFARYRGAALVKPNSAEFARAIGGDVPADSAGLDAAGHALLAQSGIGALLLTRGERGMVLVEPSRPLVQIAGRAVDVFDVTGAGDAVIATVAAARAAGCTLAHAAELANLAASIAVTRMGTVAVSAPELQAAAAARARGGSVVTAGQLEALVDAARARGERVVFTNGCFDIVHAGHVGYLAEARALGDRLVVAVNDDASVRRLKGAGRPVNRIEHRLAVLAGLAAVDWVVPFADDTPEALLERLRPDVLVKGGDYGVDGVVGAERVRAWGGEVRVLSLIDECSTTAIVARVRADDAGRT